MKLTSSAGVRMSGILLLHPFVTRVGPSLQLPFFGYYQLHISCVIIYQAFTVFYPPASIHFIF